MQGFLEAIDARVLVCDGAMGTMLYGKGIFLNRCFDELNVTQPDIVAEVHRDYINAGADVIETNTFGANRFKLAPFGLEPKVREIACRGAQIAKGVAGDTALVAGSVGPLGVQIEPLGKLSFDEAKEAFREQIAGLLEGGADLIVLETFSFLPEVVQAIRAGRELDATIPLVAQATITDDGHLVSGATLDAMVRDIVPLHVDVIGLNCSVGPKA